jgi:hypothetical protein
MFYKILFLLAATIVMAGCSSTNTNSSAERKPGSFTSITFPLVSDLWVDGQVQLAIKDKKGCGEFSGNFVPPTSDNDLALEIEGNRDYFFHISRADAQVACNKFGIFYAAKGNEYTMNLVTKNNQCEITLTEKKPNGTQSIIKTYPSHVSAVDSNRVCENKDKLY